MTNVVLDPQNTFNQLLFKSLCQPPTETDESKKIEICLITNEALEENHIKLSCGHKFNYDALFLEVIQQKKNATYLETQKLARSQIKCPYCRRIQNGILPYRPLKNSVPRNQKCWYVNWPPSLVLKTFNCPAILKYGKRKGQACDKLCCEKYCSRHNKLRIKNSKCKADSLCMVILKSGKRKGETCKCKGKIYDSKHLLWRCGKHIKKK